METSKKDLDSLWRKLIPLRNYEEDSHLALPGSMALWTKYNE